MTNPFFSFFPALPLSKTLRLGDWCIGKPDNAVAWRSPRFKDLVSKHVATFEKEGFKGGAWMWHSARGFDGSKPEPDVEAAIRATICFVALDANDHVRDDPNAANLLSTSENAELHIQPIDEQKGYITHQRGGLLRQVMSGGWKIGDDMVSLPDAVVRLLQPVVPSQHLATELSNALLNDTPVNRRIRIALEWHRFALSNSAAVSWQQRLISLKTGFEAISGESKTHLCARYLRHLFERTTSPHADHLPWAGILWSPRERTDLARTWTKNNVPQYVKRSELEEWFHALGDARNEIIHEGTFTTGVYDAPAERPLSRYAGPLFWTADRVLREAVKALLGAEVLLCGRLREVELIQRFLPAFEARRPAPPQHTNEPSDDDVWDQSDDETWNLSDPIDMETAARESEDFREDDPSTTADPILASGGSARDLPVLLAALGCDAANKVRLEKVVPHSSPTVEGAAENERRVRGFWSAAFGKTKIFINRAERDTLEAAGAEFSVRRDWTRCE
jgi:hypothetical protein